MALSARHKENAPYQRFVCQSKTTLWVATLPTTTWAAATVDEDTHTLLGEETVDGQKCWKLESLPKDKRDVYSRKTALIRQDCLIPVRVEYYDKMGKATPSSRDVGYCQGRGLLGSPEDAHDQRANRASDGSRNQESDVQHSHGGEQV